LDSRNLITPHIVANRRRIVVGLISLIVVDILQLLIPRVIRNAVNALTLYQADSTALLRYAGFITGLGLLIGAFRYVWRRCLLGTSRRVEEALRNQLFAHLQKLSPVFFDATTTGTLMAHATNDINQVRMATGMGMVALNDAVVLGAASVAFMAYINVRLTLMVLIPAPLIVLGTRFFSRQMHQRYQTVQQAFSDLTEAVRENLAGIRIVKAYTWQDQAARAVADASQGYVRRNLALARTTGAFMPMMLLLTNMSMAVVIGFGGRQTILQQISPGDFVAFISYLGLLTWPMMAMGWVTNLIQRGKASLDRLAAILNTVPAVADRADARPLRSARAALAFEQVRFHYPTAQADPQARPALQDIQLQISPGETLGVVGPPGSGKTTLLRLLARFYDPQGGAITLDGRDLRDIRLADLRAFMAVVPQEPFMFAATVRDNICLGREVSASHLAEILERTALTATLAAFPRGLDTPVGERGVVLSGGQKQRIALARALLEKRPLLLLDDPVSQLDAATAGQILFNLTQPNGAGTKLIISHRLAAVHKADRIVVLKNGRIVESGTHAELLQQAGYYADTWRLQSLTEGMDAG
jgi:ATP-binding cassette subfamily B multidrug efflux pump